MMSRGAITALFVSEGEEEEDADERNGGPGDAEAVTAGVLVIGVYVLGGVV